MAAAVPGPSLPDPAVRGQPLSVLEALAAGLPVLASRLGGNAELVGTLGEQWLVPSQDPAALARGLRTLADPGAVDRAGAAARRLHQERFSDRQNLRWLEAAYRRAGAPDDT